MRQIARILPKQLMQLNLLESIETFSVFHFVILQNFRRSTKISVSYDFLCDMCSTVIYVKSHFEDVDQLVEKVKSARAKIKTNKPNSLLFLARLSLSFPDGEAG